MQILDLGVEYSLISVQICLLHLCIIPTYSFSMTSCSHTFCLWNFFLFMPCRPFLLLIANYVLPELYFPIRRHFLSSSSAYIKEKETILSKKVFINFFFLKIRKILISLRLKFVHIMLHVVTKSYRTALSFCI